MFVLSISAVFLYLFLLTWVICVLVSDEFVRLCAAHVTLGCVEASGVQLPSLALPHRPAISVQEIDAAVVDRATCVESVQATDEVNNVEVYPLQNRSCTTKFMVFFF